LGCERGWLRAKLRPLGGGEELEEWYTSVLFFKPICSTFQPHQQFFYESKKLFSERPLCPQRVHLPTQALLRSYKSLGCERGWLRAKLRPLGGGEELEEWYTSVLFFKPTCSTFQPHQQFFYESKKLFSERPLRHQRVHLPTQALLRSYKSLGCERG
jgi:hypothetical protein